MNKGFIIGIDPDCEKSGVAIVDADSRNVVSMESLSFPTLVDFLRECACSSERPSAVVVEASWVHSHNWHLNDWNRKDVTARKGYDVGRNHETGRKIVEMCRHYKLNVIEQPPLAKTWKGRDRKITHEELAYFAPLPKSRSNPEERDATLLAWNHANLPIRVRTFVKK